MLVVQLWCMVRWRQLLSPRVSQGPQSAASGVLPGALAEMPMRPVLPGQGISDGVARTPVHLVVPLACHKGRVDHLRRAEEFDALGGGPVDAGPSWSWPVCSRDMGTGRSGGSDVVSGMALELTGWRSPAPARPPQPGAPPRCGRSAECSPGADRWSAPEAPTRAGRRGSLEGCSGPSAGPPPGPAPEGRS